MVTDGVGVLEAFEAHLRKAQKHREVAEWEFALREVNEAIRLCTSSGFPDSNRHNQKAFAFRGSIERRIGKYRDAEWYLTKALEMDDTDVIQKLDITGELGVVHRHMDDYARARDVLSKQYQDAKQLASDAEKRAAQATDESTADRYLWQWLRADQEACRAVGNLGMAIYQLSQQQDDDDLLQDAIAKLHERIGRAQALQERLQRETHFAGRIRKNNWELIGHERLTICYAAAGNTAEAVRHGEECQRLSATSTDPSARSFSRFFYGYALLRHGNHQAALECFNFHEAPHDLCTPAIVLCKEPSKEHCQYLRDIVQIGARLDLRDEQGYSALDYAVYSSHAETIGIVVRGLEDVLGHEKAMSSLDESSLKKHIRQGFQEQLRPILRAGGHDCVQLARRRYAEMLANDSDKRRIFDHLRFVRYEDFLGRGRLPAYSDNITVDFDPSAPTPFVLFFSYRWLGYESDPPIPGPDDNKNTQYLRMCNALLSFLERNPDLDKNRLFIWLVGVILIKLDVARPNVHRTLPASTKTIRTRGCNHYP